MQRQRAVCGLGCRAGGVERATRIISGRGTGAVLRVARCGTATDEFEVQIADLVGDLHHLADALGVMWPSVLARAEDYHREERLGV